METKKIPSEKQDHIKGLLEIMFNHDKEIKKRKTYDAIEDVAQKECRKMDEMFDVKTTEGDK